MPKTFNISTMKGIKQAELYQFRLYSVFDRVIVSTIGQDKIKIEGES